MSFSYPFWIVVLILCWISDNVLIFERTGALCSSGYLDCLESAARRNRAYLCIASRQCGRCRGY